MTIFDIVGNFDLKIKLYKIHEDVIKIWKYKNCICVIMKNRMLEVENCYVSHPMLGIDYDEELAEKFRHSTKNFWTTWHDSLSCHGGVTYSGELVISEAFKNSYWLGFDYAQSNDWSSINPFGVYTDIESKIAECESLAQQIIVYLENVS